MQMTFTSGILLKHKATLICIINVLTCSHISLLTNTEYSVGFSVTTSGIVESLKSLQGEVCEAFCYKTESISLCFLPTPTLPEFNQFTRNFPCGNYPIFLQLSCPQNGLISQTCSFQFVLMMPLSMPQSQEWSIWELGLQSVTTGNVGLKTFITIESEPDHCVQMVVKFLMLNVRNVFWEEEISYGLLCKRWDVD